MIRRFRKRVFRAASGLSMVELLVALALTGVLGLSVHAAFVSQIRSHSVQDQFHVMEQNAKTALDAVARELRMAGFSMAYVNGSSLRNDYALAVGTSVTLPDGTTLQTTNNDSTRGKADALVLRRCGTRPFTVTDYESDEDEGELETASSFDVNVGDFLLLMNADKDEFLTVRVGDVEVEDSTTEIEWEDPYPGSFSSPNGLNEDYSGGTVMTLRTVAFYLDSNTSTLLEQIDDKTPQVLADNVEDFQVAYQLSDGSWVVDGNVADTGAIRAVRVNILVRSPFEDTDNPIFSHVGVEDGARHPADGTDGFRRVAFSTTIKVRNMGLDL